MDFLSLGGTLLSGLVGGLVGSGQSDQEAYYNKILGIMQDYLPEISKTPYTKNEISSIVNNMKQLYSGASDVAAGRIGSALGESGMPKGQGWAEYYTQALAPTIAQGQQLSANAEMQGADIYSNMKLNTNKNIVSMLQTMMSGGQGLSNMSSAQKGVASGLNFMNLFATGYGNLTKGWKDANWQNPTATA